MASEKKLSENVNGRTHGQTDARTHGRTDDGQKVITIAHPEQSSGELKKQMSYAPDKVKSGLFSTQGQVTQLYNIAQTRLRFYACPSYQQV